MQSFLLNVYSLDPYDYSFQSIFLYLEMQFVLVYFYVFFKPIFYTNFYILWKKPGT